MAQLIGKVALVTGASSGLGAAVATLFAERGATVFGIARDANRMAEVFSTPAFTAPGPAAPGSAYRSVDITDPVACAAAVDACVARFGRLDVLVNAAGFHQMRRTGEVTDDDWAYDLAVNLNGPFYLCRAALPHLLHGGSIVNVSSVAGLEGEVYSAGYCAAKHALVGLTRALAVEFTREQVRVNAVCPGGMLTPQVTEFSPPADPDYKLIMRIAAPRGLMAPADVAAVIAFLASDEAAAIHGAIYPVDNGKLAG